MSTPSESTRRSLLAIAVLCVAQVMIVLDQNIVTIALPAIGDDLGFSPSTLVWTVNAYVVPFGGFLLLAGRLGDLLGRRDVFLIGIAAFVATSIWCGYATGQTDLLLARFAQGTAGAVTSAGLLGMVVTLAPGDRARTRAIGAFGFASAGGGALGTVIGGILTDTLGWPWIFLINVPIGIAVIALALRVVPRDSGPGLRSGVDLLGAVLVTTGIMLAVYTLIETERHGWWSIHTVAGGATTALLLAGFVARQRRARTPLIPSSITRDRSIITANLVQALMVAALFGFMFFTVMYLGRVLELDALSSGLAFLPAPLTIAVVSLTIAPVLLDAIGPRRLVLIGLPVLTLGFVLFTRIRVDGSFVVDVLPAMTLAALGFAVTMPALMALGMSGVSAADSGVASGLFTMTQQVGGAVGLAVLGAVAAARTRSGLAAGLAERTALNDGYQLGFTVATGFLVAALLVAVVWASRTGRAATREPSLTEARVG
ncbi:MFS transporter [Stackebrandtia soli]|uniref:MFS transporter n=1 Tax=Stackebrandtia soli TaxID=1892856 RepID=UPI0039EAA607